MKSNTKSSITLPPDELKLVEGLMKTLGAKSKVEVIRRGLKLLKESTDRKLLREAYQQAAVAVRPHHEAEMAQLSAAEGDGLDE